MTTETNITAFVTGVTADGTGVLPVTTLTGARQSLEDVAGAIRYTIQVNFSDGPQPYTGVQPDHTRPSGANTDLLIRSAQVGDSVGVAFIDDGTERRWYFRIAEGVALVDECPQGVGP